MKQYRELVVLVVVIAVVAIVSLARRAPQTETVTSSPAVTPPARVTVTPAAHGGGRAGMPPQHAPIVQPPLSIRGIRPGMSEDEVSKRLGGRGFSSTTDDEDPSLVVRDYGEGASVVRVCCDAAGKVRRVEGRVLEGPAGPLFDRPVDSSPEIQAVLGVRPQQGQWDDVPLSDGTRLEVTRDEYVYFRLSR